MAHVLRRVALLVLLLASAGCGGGDGDGGPSVPAPADLTAEPGAAFDDVVLTWTPPDGAFDGYVIEVRVGSGAFEEIVREPAPPGTVGAILPVHPAVPELARLGFRV